MASETSLHYATAGTTVRHLLDMRSGIGFREDYLDAHAEPTNKQTNKARLRRLLVKAGRRRDFDRDIERLRQVFTDTYLHQPPVVENAMGIQLTALLRQFDAACAARRRAGPGGDRPS